MNRNVLDFERGVIRPVACLKGGWALIKDQYWLFLGIILVGVIIMSAVPFVLIGPMMVGMYLCLFRRMRGEPVEFGDLFKGFDSFIQGLIAAAIQMVPIIVVMVPLYLIFLAVMFTSMPRSGRTMDPSEGSAFVFRIIGLELVFFVIIMAMSVVVGIFFMFAFPLIADRKLSGLDAVKTSVKAGMANFGGILGLLLLVAGLGTVGALCCYVGAIFIMPISFASYAVAYRAVFPELPQNLAMPPPPPANWA
jgi:uncharacterized membrane protein